MKSIKNFESMDSAKFGEIKTAVGGETIIIKNTYSGNMPNMQPTDTRPYTQNADAYNGTASGWDAPATQIR